MSDSAKNPARDYEELPGKKIAKQLTPAALTILISSIIFVGEFESRISGAFLVGAWLVYFSSAVVGGLVWYRSSNVRSSKRAPKPINAKSADSDSNPNEPDRMSESYAFFKARRYSQVQLALFILATLLLIGFGISTVFARTRNLHFVSEPRPGQPPSQPPPSSSCRLFKGCSENDLKAFFGYASLSPALRTEIQNTFEAELQNTFKAVFQTQVEIKAEINVLRNICAEHCRCGPTPPLKQGSHHASREPAKDRSQGSRPKFRNAPPIRGSY